jgi:hypothetical protein
VINLSFPCPFCHLHQIPLRLQGRLIRGWCLLAASNTWLERGLSRKQNLKNKKTG